MVPSKLGWIAIQEQLSQNGEKTVLEADSDMFSKLWKRMPIIENYILVHNSEEGVLKLLQWEAEVKLLIDSTSALSFVKLS